MMIDTCIICGKYVPEGRQVCYECERNYSKEKPREMTAREFLKIMKRRAVVEQRDVHIQFHPTSYTLDDFDAWIAEVAQWAKEHSEKKCKTYSEDFFEKFPNCVRRADGMPPLCRDLTYGTRNKKCSNEPNCCVTCWNEEMESEE